MHELKAISLWQPWAFLIAIDAKRYETRGWSTRYRGPMAIHAAKHWTVRMARQCYQEPFFTMLYRAGVRFHAGRDATGLPTFGLPLGAIVALADLVNVVPTSDLLPQLGPQEVAFGDFSHDRFAWQYENVIALPEPIPCKGAQGIWTPASDVQDRLLQLV